MTCHHETHELVNATMREIGYLTLHQCVTCGHGWREHSTSVEALERQAVWVAEQVRRKRVEMGLM